MYSSVIKFSCATNNIPSELFAREFTVIFSPLRIDSVPVLCRLNCPLCFFIRIQPFLRHIVNITKEMEEALKNLKQDDTITILPAEKAALV